MAQIEATDTVIAGVSNHSAIKGDAIEESLAAILVIAKIPAFSKGGKYSLFAK